MAFDKSFLKGLAERELILPYIEMGMMIDEWPDEYIIKVDSSPYYGRGDGYFHPSTHPLMQPRQLYYMMHPDTRDKMVRPKETLNSRWTLAMGSALHAVVQTQLQMTGLVKSEANIEVEFIIKEHHVRGRIDMLVDHPDGNQYIVEMKTMLPYLFKNCRKMKPEWDAQMSLQEYARGVDQGVLLLMERGDRMNSREFFHHRNDELLDQIFDKFDSVRQAVANNEPPRHCCMPESSQMKGCRARYECWLKESP